MKSNKGTIVFIHGNSSSSEVFKSSLESNSIPYNKVAINLLGHGNHNNNSTTVEDFSIEAYSKDVLNQLANINDEILLIGNSLGGHIAIEIAPKIKLLKGLVIFGTPPVKKPINFEEAFLPVPALQTFLTEHPTDKEIEMATCTAVHNKDVSHKLVSDFKKANPLVRKAIGIDLMENKLANQFDIFSNLNIPKYIIAGKQDPSVNLNYLHEVKNNCNGNCSIIEFDNCGHYPSIEKPQEFNTTLSEIVKEVFHKN
jgi:pimeloyl-ACP methyl ester carboxylesterase